MTRFRTHRFSAAEVGGGDPGVYRGRCVCCWIRRPPRASTTTFASSSRATTSLSACTFATVLPSRPTAAARSVTLSLDHATLASVLGAKMSLDDAVASGAAVIDGDHERLRRMLACFDHGSFQPSGGPS
ncbi:MAG: alkyl sulfatase C-terminal domain-containing protein [Acidimicrobiales bacterium]